MAIPENMSSKELSAMPQQFCEECLKDTGHRVAAVERVDGVFLCAFCRDGDPCPECKKLRKEKTAERRKVTLKDITDEYEGKRTFVKARGLQVRYPDEEEVNKRFKRIARHGILDACFELIKASPSGYTEIPTPRGVQPHSFQSLLSKYLRQKKYKASVHQDKAHSTVVVAKSIPGVSA